MLVEVAGDAKKRKFAPRATRRTATIATTTMALPMADLRDVMPIGRGLCVFINSFVRAVVESL
jgi:hypothetical protein